MTAPRRALIVIEAQQERFNGLLLIQYLARNESITSIQSAINTAQQTGARIRLKLRGRMERKPVRCQRT